MALRLKRWRSLKPSELVIEFARMIPNAYIMKQRDAKLLRHAMDMNALDAIDVLFGIIEYKDTAGARDIPSFCRWISRSHELFDDDRLAREGLLAERLANERLPISALAYYDLLHDTIPDPMVQRAFSNSKQQLQSFTNRILGQP